MTIMDYLGSIGMVSFNVEEDHKRKVTLIRTSRALTTDERKRCEELAYGMRVEFKVG